MRDFITAFVATWPVWLFIAILVGASLAILGDEQKARKAQRIADARAEENRKTLAHIESERQREAADIAARRMLTSPANTRKPAPWFDGKGGDAA